MSEFAFIPVDNRMMIKKHLLGNDVPVVSCGNQVLLNQMSREAGMVLPRKILTVITTFAPAKHISHHFNRILSHVFPVIHHIRRSDSSTDINFELI